MELMPCSATAAELAHDRAYRDQADPEPFMDQALEEVFDLLMTRGCVPGSRFTLSGWLDAQHDAKPWQASEEAAQLIIAARENNAEAKNALLDTIEERLRDYLLGSEVVREYAERIANEVADERDRDDWMARRYGE